MASQKHTGLPKQLVTSSFSPPSFSPSLSPNSATTFSSPPSSPSHQTVSGPTVETATDMRAWRSVMERTLVIRPANPIFLGKITDKVQTRVVHLLLFSSDLSVPSLHNESDFLISSTFILHRSGDFKAPPNELLYFYCDVTETVPR